MTVITESICTELVYIKLYTIFLLLPFYFSLYFFFFVPFFFLSWQILYPCALFLDLPTRSAHSHTTVRGRESLKAQMRSFYQSLTICVSGSLQHCPLGYWGCSPRIPSLHTHKCSSIKWKPLLSRDFFLLLLHEEEQIILALSFLPTHTILPVVPSPPSALMTCSVILTTTDLYLWNRKTEASIITQTYLGEDRAEHLVLLLGSSYNSTCFVWTPSESHIF